MEKKWTVQLCSKNYIIYSRLLIIIKYVTFIVYAHNICHYCKYFDSYMIDI